MIAVFFPVANFTPHSLTQSQNPEKKRIFIHSLDFVPKVVKNTFFKGNKKYSTFGPVSEKLDIKHIS
jgi:hypothetical protein